MLVIVSMSDLYELAVFKTKPFARFARKAEISDADLWKSAQLANRGSFDADLGGCVVKQRIARVGQGKSGGARSILLLKKDDRAVYVYGFEKKDRANIRADELEAFRELAIVVLGYSKTDIEKRVEDGALINVVAPNEESND